MRTTVRLTLGAAALALAAAWIPLDLARGAEAEVPRYGANTGDRQAVIAAIRQRVQAAPKDLDEFDEMILFTDIGGWQLKNFVAAVERRAARMREDAATGKGKQLETVQADLAAATQAKDTAKAESLQKQLESLQKAASDQRVRFRADVVGALSLEQQRDWAAYVLWGHWGGMAARFRSADLTPDQLWQAQIVVRQEMAAFVNPLTLRQDPYLWVFRHRGEGQEIRDKVAARITKEILTPDQQKKVAPGA
jgi:hypothetical protein